MLFPLGAESCCIVASRLGDYIQSRQVIPSHIKPKKQKVKIRGFNRLWSQKKKLPWAVVDVVYVWFVPFH